MSARDLPSPTEPLAELMAELGFEEPSDIELGPLELTLLCAAAVLAVMAAGVAVMLILEPALGSLLP